jgi:hypothetical protein
MLQRSRSGRDGIHIPAYPFRFESPILSCYRRILSDGLVIRSRPPIGEVPWRLSRSRFWSSCIEQVCASQCRKNKSWMPGGASLFWCMTTFITKKVHNPFPPSNTGCRPVGPRMSVPSSPADILSNSLGSRRKSSIVADLKGWLLDPLI